MDSGKRLRVAAQTITWGESIGEDMPQICQALHRLGYEGVEIGVRHFNLARPEYYAALFAEHNLAPVAVHTGGTFWDPAQAEREVRQLSDAIAFAQAVGFRYFALSGNKDETPESMVQAAASYDRLGGQCREAGLQLVYHNHDWELANDGATLRVLLDKTTPENVHLLPDIAWLYRAGVNAAAFLRDHAARIAYVHLKDSMSGEFCELGQGNLPLEDILNTVNSLPVGWIVVEQDTTARTPEESLALSADYLKQRGLIA